MFPFQRGSRDRTAGEEFMNGSIGFLTCHSNFELGCEYFRSHISILMFLINARVINCPSVSHLYIPCNALICVSIVHMGDVGWVCNQNDKEKVHLCFGISQLNYYLMQSRHN